ncbi:MAG: DNA replication complex GINS family protein [Thermoplasmata archaeon]|nr:DNA replication complex GINS family protein [Thermoplasmata archaeon]
MADYYTRLLELRRAEGSAHGLSKLPGEFYTQTRSYLAELKSTFETELRENPSGRKGELARQTHQRAVQTARDIVEARMMKILTAALQASLGGARELPNSLPEERALHESMLSYLRQHRSEVAPYLEPVGPPPAVPKKAVSTSARSAAREPAPPRTSVTSSGSDEVQVVRILQDSPKVALGSESIALRRDDVVSFPADVARLLVEGRIAEPVRVLERFSPALR